MEINCWKPYEQVIKDYYEGDRNAKLTVYNDIAGKEILSGRHIFRRAEEMEALEQYALDQCKGSVLDIGAGAGAMSLILKNRGHQVKPIDIVPEAVEVMKKRGLEEAECLSIWGDFNETFDTLLLMMNGIGLVHDLKGLSRFLTRAHKLVNPGGHILLDSTDLRKQLTEKNRIFEPDYMGEVIYRLKYKDLRGEPYKWLFADFNTLSILAR